MLLAIDVGNTQTHLGVFDRQELIHEWRASTDHRRTADELALMFGEFLRFADLSFSHQISGVVIASVVPRASQELRSMTARYFGFPAVVVEPGVKTGIAIRIDNPKEVGADRVANAVAARHLFPDEPAIVVDFGTAINFDVVTAAGEYIGGALAPGVESSAAALFQATARLPRVELTAPATTIGRNTVAAVQSGIVFGVAGLVDGLVDRTVEELGAEANVIATGGHADTIAGHCRSIQQVQPALTLLGLRLIFDRNADDG